MIKKAQERKEQKEKEKYSNRRITIPYVEGLYQEIRRELKEIGIPVSFKAHEIIGKTDNTQRIQCKKNKKME